MTTVLAIVGILHREQFKVFLPVRSLLGQWRGAKTSFHPARNAIPSDAGLLQVVKILVASNRTLTERALSDRVSNEL